MDRADLKNDVRIMIAETVDGRFIDDSDLDTWANKVLATLSNKVRFLKESITIAGNGQVAALGTDPKFFQLPANFLRLDMNQGVQINGIREFGEDEREILLHQPMAIASLGEAGGTVTIDTYYSSPWLSLKMNYTIDRSIKSEIDAARTGKLLWFTPNPEDADTIVVWAIVNHDTLAADGDEIVGLETDFEELVVMEVALKALNPMVIAGAASPSAVKLISDQRDALLIRAIKHYNRSEKMPDRRPRIKTAGEISAYYTSGQGRRTGTSALGTLIE